MASLIRAAKCKHASRAHMARALAANMHANKQLPKERITNQEAMTREIVWHSLRCQAEQLLDPLSTSSQTTQHHPITSHPPLLLLSWVCLQTTRHILINDDKSQYLLFKSQLLN